MGELEENNLLHRGESCRSRIVVETVEREGERAGFAIHSRMGGVSIVSRDERRERGIVVRGRGRRKNRQEARFQGDYTAFDPFCLPFSQLTLESLVKKEFKTL